ncbi:MAG: type IV pilus twitching motility protein PilT [Deltaproteobacteria bacterium]|nr:MAG: type IV pilus twitching motility protein PilT [Deltaproteobacteria bacterium]
MNLKEILQLAVQFGASDIHFKVGVPPTFRVDGQLKPLLNVSRLTEKETRQMAMGLMNEAQRAKFLKTHDLDTAYSIPGLSRFRVNIFQQRGTIALVFRVIPQQPPDFEALNIPEVVGDIALQQNGLVIVTGSTGSGKSTTLAAMIEYINRRRNCSIITIEDPIEYTFRDHKALISQREVCVDTENFASALRHALRQDPDVIMVGEMRDRETIETVLIASETGHLVLSTMHSTDVSEAIHRILSVFPVGQQDQIRYQLASVLKAIIAIRLVPLAEGEGRIPAMEILVSTSHVRECLRNPKRLQEIKEVMAEGQSTYGMQTFDRALYRLYRKGLVSQEDAVRFASNPNDFQIRIMGIQGNTQESEDSTRTLRLPESKKKGDEERETTVYRFTRSPK